MTGNVSNTRTALLNFFIALRQITHVHIKKYIYILLNTPFQILTVCYSLFIYSSKKKVQFECSAIVDSMKNLLEEAILFQYSSLIGNVSMTKKNY